MWGARHILLCLAVGVACPGARLASAPAGDQTPAAGKQQPRPQAQERRRDRAPAPGLPAEVEALQSLSAVLGRPTDRMVATNLLANEALELAVAYGPESGGSRARTEPIRLQAGVPAEAVLQPLQPDTAYAYCLLSRKPGQADFTAGPDHAFHTQRAPGSAFTFEVQGDSHPERPQQFDPALYAQTLSAAAADHPDFYITLGDDFSVDKAPRVTAEVVDRIYLDQRLYLALVGQSAPVFLVNGNHEQAAACNLNGTPDNVAVWAQTARNRLFALPAPDGFYSGDPEPVRHIGLLRDYYAWTWGDALFVVIDPYWHSAQPVDNVYGGRSKARDLWGNTLGEAQYRWLQQTLASSKARFTFVFAHHVLGTGRGGVELASRFEWGGQSKNGDNEFARQRPGWELPLHQLMAKHAVTIFFQGHDHVFVRQELDGVVYQTLPEPADPNYSLYNRDAYRTGDALPNSGRVRVTVSPARVSVDYLRSWLPKDTSAEHPDNAVAFHYEILARAGTVTPGATGLPRTSEGKAR